MSREQSPRTIQNNDEWFSHLFSARPSFVSDKHPSLEELKFYLEGRLLNEDKKRVYDPSRTDWTMTKVSFHLLDCKTCSAQIAQLRQLEVVCHRALEPSWWERLRDRILQPRAVRLHLKTFTAVAIALLTINLGAWFWLNNAPKSVTELTVLPPPTVESPALSANSLPDARSIPIDMGGSTFNTPLKSNLPTPFSIPGTNPVAITPLPPPASFWWSLGFVLFWATLWLAHMLTQAQQQQRWRQALQRMFSPSWYAEPHYDMHSIGAFSQVSTWAALTRC